jgi:hypothetical protein
LYEVVRHDGSTQTFGAVIALSAVVEKFMRQGLPEIVGIDRRQASEFVRDGSSVIAGTFQNEG